jgi:hypothetical protein
VVEFGTAGSSSAGVAAGIEIIYDLMQDDNYDEMARGLCSVEECL